MNSMDEGLGLGVEQTRRIRVPRIQNESLLGSLCRAAAVEGLKQKMPTAGLKKSRISAFKPTMLSSELAMRPLSDLAEHKNHQMLEGHMC